MFTSFCNLRKTTRRLKVGASPKVHLSPDHLDNRRLPTPNVMPTFAVIAYPNRRNRTLHPRDLTCWIAQHARRRREARLLREHQARS